MEEDGTQPPLEAMPTTAAPRTLRSIPTTHLNEWGFPSSALWAFAGFRKGAGGYRPTAGAAAVIAASQGVSE